MSFSATDEGGSGLDGTSYTLDGELHEYTGPFAVSGDGSHEITWWSEDAAGNAEAAHTGYVNIWGTAPVTSASAAVAAAADEGWRTAAPQPVSLTAAGGHGALTVHYVLDGGAQADAAGEAAFDVAADGSHTLEYWATDELGNEEAHQTGYVNLDTAAPDTTDAFAGGDAWQSGPVSFSLAASDALSGVDATSWSVDGGAAQSGTDVLVTGDGEHTVTYSSTDAAGNAEAPRSVTVRIDAGAPETGDDAPAGWRNAGATVTLTPADALSGMTGGLAATTWELDGAATQAGTSVPVDAPSDHSGDGVRTIAYRSTDAAGNLETDRSATVLIDTLAPTTRDDLAAGPPVHTDPVTVTLSASDEHGSLAVSGVAVTHYRVDDGPWQTGTSVEVTGDGEHTVSYYSTDNAGNDEAVRTSATLSIATTPPGASSDDAPAGWVAHPVTVTLTPGARALRTTWELDGGATPDRHQCGRGRAGRPLGRRRPRHQVPLVGLRRRGGAHAHGRGPDRHGRTADRRRRSGRLARRRRHRDALAGRRRLRRRGHHVVARRRRRPHRHERARRPATACTPSPTPPPTTPATPRRRARSPSGSTARRRRRAAPRPAAGSRRRPSPPSSPRATAAPVSPRWSTAPARATGGRATPCRSAAPARTR